MDVGAEDGPRRNQGGVVSLWPATLAPTLNAHFGEKQGLEDQHINGGAVMFVLDKQTAQVGEMPSPTLKTDLSHQMGPVIAVPQVLRNREGKAGGGKGPLLSENQSLTLATSNDQVVFAATYSTPAIGDVRADSVASTLSANSGGGGETQNPAFVLDVSHTISAKWSKMSGGTAGGTEINNLVVPQLRPRRLTPTECERLQGFPDDFTLVPWRKGMAPDGPRYRALGNSMAVPCMLWIGKRIQRVEEGNA